jgi:hypothetical protein
MPTIERAAAHLPGFGVKLWMVLQDLAQLQWQYRNSWQTMIGNAGLVQFFATLNLVTNDDILGAPRHDQLCLKGPHDRRVEGEAAQKERLIYPTEIEKTFATRTGARA